MKRLVVGVVAALAASLWAAPSANADELAHCVPGEFPEQNVVVIGPGWISVRPENAPGYVTGTSDVLIEYAICVLQDVLGPTANCLTALMANRPTVTVDVNPPSVTIDYDEFIHTACQ